MDLAEAFDHREEAPEAARTIALQRVVRSGQRDSVERDVAMEMPIAIEVDGLAYAVLMASPADIEDLAIGFVLAERLADNAADVIDLDVHDHPAGRIVRLTMAARVAGRTADRVRHRVSDSACGLCGVENLEQTMRPLPAVARRFQGDIAAIFAATEALGAWQKLNRTTGAAHAAALCDGVGGILLVREDVGRHNAFDKLIGAMARGRLAWDGGFALLTSRCSYELVEKAAVAGCPLLATISAPTSLALDRAAAAGLPLVSLARADSLLFAP